MSLEVAQSPLSRGLILWLQCSIHTNHHQAPTELFVRKMVILRSITLHCGFVETNQEEMLHGEHPEEKAIPTKQRNQNQLIFCNQ